jgi:hypothetical protein
MKPHSLARVVALALVSILALPVSLHAWGAKGHQMQARVALKNLPADVPAFFREATEEMAMLISEPDFWRTAEQRNVDETTGVNHTFRWETAPKPLPANRHFFIIELTKQGRLKPETNSVREAGGGTAPYGIQEWSEMLTAAFRRWRAMPEGTPEEIRRKRMHEHSILFIAGVLGHWVTDTSNPIHSSIHVHGWHPSVPNPNGYAGPDNDPHGRFEGAYVNANIELADVAALVDNKPRLLGDWLQEAAKHIESCNAHVEQIFKWDKQVRFGAGNEPAEAKPFTAARLADGARAIRDFWYTAWMRSGVQIPGAPKGAAKKSND